MYLLFSLVASITISISVLLVILRPLRDLKSSERYLLIALSIFAFGIAILSANPYAVSDGVEYVALARRLIIDDSPTLIFDGREIPSRYPIWFSLFFLGAPAALAAQTWGFVVPIALSLSLLVVTVGLLSCKLVGKIDLSTLLVVLLLALIIPEVRVFSQVAITDIPSAALVSVFVLGILEWRSSKMYQLALSLLLAVAVSLRATNTLVALPFLFLLGRAPLFSRVLMLVPLLFISALTLLLNKKLYGDFFRTGYQLWLSVPYDYFGLTFSARFIPRNLLLLLSSPLSFLLVLLFGALVIKRGWKEPERRFVFAALVGSTGLSIFYLSYFYFSARFFLPLVPLCLPVIAASASVLVSSRWMKLSALVLAAGLFLGIVLSPKLQGPELQKILQLSQGVEGLVVTDQNPLLVEEFVIRGTGRRVVPAHRELEYASKVLVWDFEQCKLDFEVARSIRPGMLRGIQGCRSEEVYRTVKQ